MPPLPRPETKIKHHSPFDNVISEVDLFGHLAWREQLTELILLLKQDNPIPEAGHMIAWFSARNLHEVQHPAITWVVRKISRAAINCVAQTTGREHGIDVRLKECWAMVNEAGQWSPPDNDMAMYSGIAFISGQAEPENEHPLIHDALLALYNPVPMAGKLGFPASFTIAPKDGSIFIFPGYMTRMLTPHRLAQPLVSIGFNLDIVA